MDAAGGTIQSLNIASGSAAVPSTIELYANSKFTSCNKDSLKREKSVYNICKFRVNVAVRATDLDTKDVTIVADDEGAYGQSFALSLKNRK